KSVHMLIYTVQTALIPSSTLFPYTTLFRSLDEPLAHQDRVLEVVAAPGHERAQHVAAERQLPFAGRRPVRDHLRLLDLLPLDHRSEEHTSELQSRGHLVCRLLLEKKNILNL